MHVREVQGLHLIPVYPEYRVSIAIQIIYVNVSYVFIYYVFKNLFFKHCSFCRIFLTKKLRLLQEQRTSLDNNF